MPIFGVSAGLSVEGPKVGVWGFFGVRGSGFRVVVVVVVVGFQGVRV